MPRSAYYVTQVINVPQRPHPVGGENLTGEYDRARAAFVRLDLDPEKLDLTPRAPLRPPRSPIGGEWMALPGADRDYLGRRLDIPAFGACRHAGGEAACR